MTEDLKKIELNALSVYEDRYIKTKINENSVLEVHINENSIENKFYNYYFDNLVQAKKLETKNILINEKNSTALTIDFTRYDHKNSMKMLILCYDELMEKIGEHEGRIMFNGWVFYAK